MSGYTSVVDATPMFVPGTFDGQDVRLATIGNAAPGLFASGDFLVAQRAAGANMSVDIGAGRAYVNPAAVARQGSYVVWSGSTFNTSSNGGYTWTAADPTNPRIDLLCIEVADTDFSGGYTGYKWRIVDGTPNAGATAANLRQYWPSVPSGCLVVAAIRIPAAATTITTANIFNLDTVGGPRIAGGDGIQTFAASGTILPDMGSIVTWDGGASETLTAPAATRGRSFEVWNLDTSNVVAVSRAGADTITDNLTTGATSFRVPPGAQAKFVCVADGVWIASYKTMVVKTGLWNPAAGTGNKSVTGIGFRPKVVDFIYQPAGSTADATSMHGTMDAAGLHHVSVMLVQAAGRSHVAHNTLCIGLLSAATGTALAESASFVSMDVDGFTVNFGAKSGSGTSYRFIARA